MSSARARSTAPVRLGPQVGSGGGGDVYMAWTDDGQPRALKVAHGCDDACAARAAREVATTRRLAGGAFPRIYCDGRAADGRHWHVMEWIGGGTLGQRLTSQPATVAVTVALALAVTRALATAHRAGVIHRDLKPDNIMFRSDGTMVLIDLGLARSDDDPGTSATRCAGTPQSMAPERILGDAVPRNRSVRLGRALVPTTRRS